MADAGGDEDDADVDKEIGSAGYVERKKHLSSRSSVTSRQLSPESTGGRVVPRLLKPSDGGHRTCSMADFFVMCAFQWQETLFPAESCRV
jgi:hypothetical protein